MALEQAEAVAVGAAEQAQELGEGAQVLAVGVREQAQGWALVDRAVDLAAEQVQAVE